MNDLSLFLYAAGVIGNVTVLLGISLSVLAFGFFGLLMYYGIEKGTLCPHWGKLTAAIFVLSLVTTLIPSKNTMYAIAASQMGEQAVKSQIGQKTLGALEAWLDKQIEKK